MLNAGGRFEETNHRSAPSLARRFEHGVCSLTLFWTMELPDGESHSLGASQSDSSRLVSNKPLASGLDEKQEAEQMAIFSNSM